MITLFDFCHNCLLVLQSTGKLSRHAIRHAISMFAPLGTKSADIDHTLEFICEVLLKTKLVTMVDGVLYYNQTSTTPVVLDN